MIRYTAGVDLYAFSGFNLGETLTLREGYRLRGSVNRVLRRIFGPKRDEVTGFWRRLHNVLVLFSKHILNDQIKEDEIGRACSTHGEKRNACRILVGKPDGKRPLERPRRRREDDIRIDLIEIGWGGVDWIDLTTDRDQWGALVNAVINFRVL
jgi:hypothetical protein